MIHPKDVIVEMHTDHVIPILYNKVLRAKEYAKNLAYSEPLHTFQKLLLYLYMLMQKIQA